MNLKQAIKETAFFFIKNAISCKIENLYASHVTEKTKTEVLNKSLKFAQEIREGKHYHNFTVRQRIDYYMTGESRPLLE